MKLIKLLLAVVGATVLLGALTSSASARSFSISSQNFRATWARMDFTGGFGTVECEVTLEASLHSRVIDKTAGRLVGFITRAIVRRPCIRGEALVLAETLPWHVRYVSFTGSLPNISAITAHVIGASFWIQEPTFGARCLARSTTEQPALGIFNRNTATRLITSVTVGGTIRCRGAIEANGTLGGTSSNVGELSNINTKITVTLI